MAPPVLWKPRDDAHVHTTLGQFQHFVEVRVGRVFADYDELWAWSTGEGIEDFWLAVWDFFEIRTESPVEKVLGGEGIAAARWFEGAQLNYAEHICRNVANQPDAVALVGLSQSRERTQLTWRELEEQVARARKGLHDLGVGRGDRVAAYVPNIPEAVIAFLATCSLGAIWTSCAPEFGLAAVVDRFSQVEPKVLIAVDGYRYGRHEIQRESDVRELRSRLSTLEHTVIVPYLNDAALPEFASWSDLLAESAPLEFESVPPDHPLYVLYSSGTTGLPKAIIHSHGGILVEHFKVLGLHGDMTAQDVFFWFTTTGWMMWNFLVSGLLVGSCVVLFDGDPAAHGPATLWRIAEQERVSWFGAGASYYAACRKSGLVPMQQHDLDSLRVVGSTGSPLPPECYEWIYSSVAPAALLTPVSGGTDVCSAFVGGSPLTPVWQGEIPCRYLGVAAHAFDSDGNSVVGQQGELVITKPMPSMPVGFWGDDDGSRYRSAYFEHYPGVWRHGDWITITERGSCIISGRSDATLNRGGVRIGTAEIYRVVEALAEVTDSLVVHLEGASADDPGQLVLFLVIDPRSDLESCTSKVRQTLRRELSPRHVPDHVIDLPSIPTTLSGKKVEVPTKQVLNGAAPDTVVSRASLRDPTAIDHIVKLASSAAWRSIQGR
jgi:acetoacetyl-CoA synthetase